MQDVCDHLRDNQNLSSDMGYAWRVSVADMYPCKTWTSTRIGRVRVVECTQTQTGPQFLFPSKRVGLPFAKKQRASCRRGSSS